MQFTRYQYTSDLFPAAVLQPWPPMCGIYVLEFANGEEYVGQTIRLQSRLESHRRRWSDIVGLRFHEAAREELNEKERQVITQRRDDGIQLRNLVLLTQPTGPSPLDLVVDKEVQVEWLAADLEGEGNDFGDRIELALRRQRSRAQFDALREHEAAEDVIDMLALYVANVIPWPDTTEGRSWTVSALPSTNKSREHRRLAALSINNVEMLYIAEDFVEGEWQPFTALNTAVIRDLPPEIAELEPEVGEWYRSAGPVMAFRLVGFPLDGLFEDGRILRAARELAVSQLRKGRGMFQRFHNDALTDAIYARIGEFLEAQE